MRDLAVARRLVSSPSLSLRSPVRERSTYAFIDSTPVELPHRQYGTNAQIVPVASAWVRGEPNVNQIGRNEVAWRRRVRMHGAVAMTIETISTMQLQVSSAFHRYRRLLTSSSKNFPGGRRSALL